MFSTEGNIVHNLLRCLLQVQRSVRSLGPLSSAKDGNTARNQLSSAKDAGQQETNCRLLKIVSQQETNKFSDPIPPCVDKKSKDI